MSIRLSPDGLSFWTCRASGADAPFPACRPSGECFVSFDPKRSREENISDALAEIKTRMSDRMPVALYIDTLKSILIPSDLFDEESAAAYLKIHNISVSDREAIAVIDVSKSIKAIVIYDRTTTEQVGAALETEPIVNTPFCFMHHWMSAMMREGRYGAFYISDNNVYMAIGEGILSNMLYFEVMPWKSPADILYYLHTLDGQFELKKSPIHIKGVNAEEVTKYLRKYFKHVQCG